jgi:MoaA/NifB/PqqE/SkfB family radical SAM enzyme
MRVDHPFRSVYDFIVHGAPIEAQLVVTRRCNLSCGYCSEYDKHSPEIPFEVLCERIDAIHRLRCANIALLGGEPLLHSRIHDIVRYAAARAQVSITTNGLLLDRGTIDRLGDAGLANLQVSIDTVNADPTRYIQKTLHSLAPKLDRLAAHARFEVHLATVLCPETVHAFDDLLAALERYPFRIAVHIVHDDNGQALVAGAAFERAWRRHYDEGRPFSFIEEKYGRRVLAGERPEWTCQAGARFLYVGEDGTVELCSGQKGRIRKQITDYTRTDLDAHRNVQKGCERGCSILCAYRDSMLDDDPPALIASVLRGFRKGVRWRPPGAAESAGATVRHLPLAPEGNQASSTPLSQPSYSFAARGRNQK